MCMIHVFWGECVSGPPDTHYILCTHTTAHVSPPRRARLPRPSPSAAGRLPAARLRLQVLVVVGRGVVVRVAEVLPRLHLGHVARALHLGLAACGAPRGSRRTGRPSCSWPKFERSFFVRRTEEVCARMWSLFGAEVPPGALRGRIFAALARGGRPAPRTGRLRRRRGSWGRRGGAPGAEAEKR